MKLSTLKLSLLASVFLLVISPLTASAYDMNGIDVKPRASIAETYDDNITFSKNNKIDDFITRATVGLEAKAAGKTRTLDLNGNLNYELFADHSDFNNVSGDFNGDFTQELDQYNRFRLRDYFIRADEPRTFEEAFNRIQGRYHYLRNRVNVDYMHDFTEQWSLTGRYGNEVTDFSSSDIPDSDFNTAGVEALYQHTSTLKFLFAYDFSIRDFSGGNSAEVNTLTTGILYYLTKQLYAEARIGVDFINPYTGSDLTEPLFRASLTDDIDATTRWDLAFEKEYAPNSYTEAIFNYWQISTSLRKQLSERFGANATVFYGDGTYVDTSRTDKLWGVNAGLTYDLTKNWQGSLRYTYTDVSSSVVSQEYTRNTVMLGLTLAF